MDFHRNTMILSAVLRGWTLAQVGEIFSISSNRVRQIAIKTSRRLGYSSFSVKELRGGI